MLFTVANNELQYRWAMKLRPFFLDLEILRIQDVSKYFC